MRHFRIIQGVGVLYAFLGCGVLVLDYVSQRNEAGTASFIRADPFQGLITGVTLVIIMGYFRSAFSKPSAELTPLIPVMRNAIVGAWAGCVVMGYPMVLRLLFAPKVYLPLNGGGEANPLTVTQYVILFWVVWVLAIIAVGVWVIRRVFLMHRLTRTGEYCRSCGYSLTGNTSGSCPECGRPVNKGESENANH